MTTTTETVRLADGLAEQTLVPGVAPVSQARRELEALQHARGRRRGHAAPPTGGLFDVVARAQLDLF